MRYDAGTRVRFLADNLGTLAADGSTPEGEFETPVVMKYEAGEVVESELIISGAPAGAEWFAVKPDGYPELIVPVIDGLVELDRTAD